MATKWLIVYRVQGDYTVLHTTSEEPFSELKRWVARKHDVSTLQIIILAYIYLSPMQSVISNDVMSILEEYKE